MQKGEPFGQTREGEAASLFTLENEQLRVRITDWGGRMVSIEAPDRAGKRDHVLLGFDDVGQYITNGGSFGALLGRNANRIARADLVVEGQHYQLIPNDRGNTSHGGPRGFGMLMWQVASASDDELVLNHTSPDGDQGFPGELPVEARYRLSGGTLSLTLTTSTTQVTDLSLSTHPYFNLAGPTSGDIYGHEVTIAADSFLPTDVTQMPLGEIRPVAGTPFDFRQPTTIGARIRQADQQLLVGNGYDHFFVLEPVTDGQPRFAARLRDPASGRTLDVHTTQPGTQLYTANQLKGVFAGRGGLIYRQSVGAAFEPQGFPDAAHNANFESCVLRPGETYRQIIEFRFSAS
ncbi:MAG: galactose mutarotase [Alphaproteobacteria bacterium]|nr:galactose mutarotase [Alphaproteobacteria bacterium]